MKLHRLRGQYANAQAVAPDLLGVLRNVEAYLQRCGLDRRLLDLVIIDLTAAVGVINLWNRLMISLRCDHPADATA